MEDSPSIPNVITGIGLLVKASAIPHWISILLFVAGSGYMVIHALTLLGREMEGFQKTLEGIMAVPMAAGELSLAFWLICRGGKRVKLK